MATDDKPADNKPTAKQLRYLRALCEATGETTSWPQTRQEASRAIERLKKRPRSDADERQRDRREVKDLLARGGRP